MDESIAGISSHGVQAAAAGTWDGPAPKGQLSKELRGRAGAATAAPRAPPPRSVRLGGGVRLPMLIAGTAGSAADAAHKVGAALAAGVRAFDVAMVDDTAAAVGAALGAHKGGRDELFVISKVRAWISVSCDLHVIAISLSCRLPSVCCSLPPRCALAGHRFGGREEHAERSSTRHPGEWRETAGPR